MSGPTEDLPPMVRVISLHEPYATLVVEGIKTIETRTWDWPYKPSWLAIYATKRFDKDAFTRLRLSDAYHATALPGGGIVGLAWVASSRALLPSDEADACSTDGKLGSSQPHMTSLKSTEGSR